MSAPQAFAVSLSIAFAMLALALGLMSVVWLSIGAYQGLGRKALRVVGGIQALQCLLVAGLVAGDAISRMGVFANYAVMAWTGTVAQSVMASDDMNASAKHLTEVVARAGARVGRRGAA